MNNENLQEQLIPEEINEESTTLPPEIIYPDIISLDTQQYEIIIQKMDDIKLSIDNNTIMMSILLGFLIGIVFVRGLSRYVKGV